jgi:glycine C-acetyltransferase
MSTQTFLDVLKKEVARIDAAQVTKRTENLIERFTTDPSPKAVINGKEYRVFNSNDYLGLRHHPKLKAAEHAVSQTCGTGPGAVRFISGSFTVHRDLEKALAQFHGRDDAMVFSSAFATNLAVLFSLIKGQSKDSLVSNETLVISDELNHRSIIDGIRLANLTAEQKLIFKHLDMPSLDATLKENVGKFTRVIVVTDGVFSMLGEYQDLKAMRAVTAKYDPQFPEGVLLIVDDAHGVAAFGKTGRGTEEVSGAQADVLIGTLGKGFGVDGGYVVANQTIIDYLRESAATYIYSNSISPGTAAAALAAVKLVDSKEGLELLKKSASNVSTLKAELTNMGIALAAESVHPIQPVLIGQTDKTKALKMELFEKGFLVTNINYPVVPKGKDEIRVQISATHTDEDLTAFLTALHESAKKVGVV